MNTGLSFRARIGILTLTAFGLAVALSWRLLQVSVIKHGFYIAKAAQIQEVKQTITPRRGTVYVQDAASGIPTVAAESIERFGFSMTPYDVDHKEEFATLLAPFAGIDREKLLASLKRTNADGKVTKYMEPLIHNLTKDQVVDLSQKINRLYLDLEPTAISRKIDFDSAQGDNIYFVNGSFFIREYERIYPEGQLLGQALGFVNGEGEGQYGFEGQYNDELAGYAGQAVLARDSRGRLLTVQKAVDGKDGANFQLTIDRNVQYQVEQELAYQVKDAEAKSGSVIVMDPKTGGIIAMANYPSYDPNNYRTVGKDDLNLFTNTSISSIWEPGSIVKPLVMAAAIDQKLVGPETTDVFPASVTVDGYTINTALLKAYGKETMTDVLVNSDNVAMVWVGNKLGNQTMADYFGKYGFGSKTGVDLKGEVAGAVTPVKRWSDISRSTMTFGQGIGVTPMQIITAYSAIAGDGRIVKPHIVKAVQAQGNSAWQDSATTYGSQVMTAETAKTLRTMLEQVVEKEHKRAGVDGYSLGGKTGTAQVPDSVNGGYLADTYNHSFVGMGPLSDPKFLMLTKIDEPNIAKVSRYAEGTAVPLFGRLSKFLLNYYQIPPTKAQ